MIQVHNTMAACHQKIITQQLRCKIRKENVHNSKAAAAICDAHIKSVKKHQWRRRHNRPTELRCKLASI